MQSLSVAFALLALLGIRWAYVAFIALALAYFPMHAGFALQPRTCELLVDGRLALHSLENHPHIVLFALFFVLSYAHSTAHDANSWALAFAAVSTLTMGALVELAEGATGSGHCRLRDLLPDTVGIALGAATIVLLRTVLPVRWADIASRARHRLGLVLRAAVPTRR